jgi:nucleoprotein TPR
MYFAHPNHLLTELSDAETARAALENELVSYRTSRTTLDEEARQLKIRVHTLESEQRNTLEALDRKFNEYDKLQEEATSAQQKQISARREIGALETKLQQAESAQSNAKFRVKSLEQEVEMLKRNNEWLDAELKAKTTEYQKFRKEKAAQISSLNSELEEAIASVEMTKRSYESLKERYEEISQNSEDRLTKIKDLQSDQATREENFRKEIHSHQRLAELYQESMKSAKTRLSEVEAILEQERESDSVELGQTRAALETERAEKEAAEKRVSELEIDVERLEGELASYGNVLPTGPGSPQESLNGNSTPVRQPGSSMGNRGTPGSGIFSPAASRLQKSGVSVTQLYSDYNQVKAAYETQKRRNMKLEEAITGLMDDLEQKAPEIQELRDDHERLEKDLLEMSKLLESASKERDQAKKDARKMTNMVSNLEQQEQILRQQLRDLSTQLQVFLADSELRDAGVELLSAQPNRVYEEIINGNLTIEGQTDTDHLITQQLTVFRNVQEMQEKNQNLLKAIRVLGAKMEKAEEDSRIAKEEQDNEEILRLEATIERLKDEIKHLALKSQTFIRERDMFRRMLQNKGELNHEGSPAQPASDAGSVAVAELQQNLGEVLKNLQCQYDQFKTEALESQNTINEQNRRLATEKSELEVQVARINSHLEMATGMLLPN